MTAFWIGILDPPLISHKTGCPPLKTERRRLLICLIASSGLPFMNLMVILYQDYVFLTIVEAVCKVKSQAYAWHITWQGLKDDYRTYCGIISFSNRGEDNA